MALENACRLLIVEDDLDYAATTAARLAGIDSRCLHDTRVDIEITNNAQYVIERLRTHEGDVLPWDLILSDVYMPRPASNPNVPESPSVRETTLHGRAVPGATPAGPSWRAWLYEYTYNRHTPGEIGYGGLAIARELRRLRDQKRGLAGLKLVLISGCLTGEDRERLFEFLPAEGGWFKYYDKACWEEVPDWPSHQLRPNAFCWAVIHAINERTWSLFGDAAFGDLWQANLSPRMMEVVTEARSLAHDPNTRVVLITGEGGSGKTELAAMIHRVRMEALKLGGKFVRATCTTLPPEHFESELFGEAGPPGREGLAEAARDGTLFLDEIGEVPPTAQGKLLDLLDGRGFRRVGSTEPAGTGPSLVLCATRRDLPAMVRNGDFREDLFNRLQGAWLPVPALRDRRDDIVAYALEAIRKSSRPYLELKPPARQWLKEQPWPGNVRQLFQVVSDAVRKCIGSELTVSDLRDAERRRPLGAAETVALTSTTATVTAPPPEVTPEALAAGQCSWTQLLDRLSGPGDRPRRVALLVAARALFTGSPGEFADKLKVSPTFVEQFLNVAHADMRSGSLKAEQLYSAIPSSHQAAIRKFCDQASQPV